MNVYLVADEEETQNSIKLIQKEERIKSKMIWCFHVICKWPFVRSPSAFQDDLEFLQGKYDKETRNWPTTWFILRK